MDRLQWGGLKDRHAATTQYVSIFRGPRRNFEQPNIRLEYLGQIPRAVLGRRDRRQSI